jgi:hydrogenase nickel incorporation protein HypA/HybF
MHEVGIASTVLEAVERESAERNGARVLKVGVRIGELASVDPEALRFCLEALVRGTDLEPLEFDLEFCPRRNRCLQCGDVFDVAGAEFDCPKGCAGPTEFAGGDELEFAYMEIDDEPHQNGSQSS